MFIRIFCKDGILVNLTSKQIFKLILVIIFSCILISCIVLFIFYGIIPCSLKKCHPNAYCINRPFFGDCVCKYGYHGNGNQYCDECGINYFENNARIIGGVEAIPHSWPSTVLIMVNYKAFVSLDNDSVLISTNFMCSGNLINRRTVLTAAHCLLDNFNYIYNQQFYTINVTRNIFYPTIESVYTIYLGADRTVQYDVNIKPTEPIKVEKVIKHPYYDPKTITNDIAILKLTKSVDLNKYVQLACLPKLKSDFYPTTNSSAIVVGWGSLDQFGNMPNYLYNVKITVYNETICRNVSIDTEKSWNSQICAGEYYGGKDTCSGDSGGPLFVSDIVNDKQKYILSGVTSYGEGCAQPYLPGIYTRVSYFLDWIMENSKF